jgi:ADP-heptose:LPS heptosyltransferase
LRVISNSFIAIGQLSGPIHLAHMANRPVITWADSKERFETIRMWNPHKQDCLVVSESTFNPEVDLIVDSLLRFVPANQF